MSLNKKYKTLRLILGDQLNKDHSWFNERSEEVLYLIMELKQETNYVNHHIQKIVAFFLAMEEFQQHLNNEGHHVLYFDLDHEGNTGDLSKNIKLIVDQYNIQKFEYQLPDEYRLDQQLNQLQNELKIPVEFMDTEHFLTKRNYLYDFFKGKKQLLMEYFYRSIRKEYNIIMSPEDASEPLTGKWNYDHENRGSINKSHQIIEPKFFSHEVNSIVKRIEAHGIKTIGEINPNQFIWPINYEESNEMLDFFLKNALHLFGKFQDAMVERSWSVYHSRLSFAMNAKIISPLEVVERAVEYWEENKEKISIAQIEGFVRQIIGWREYMRGVYWAYMPEYADKNYFNHKRKLPSFYWTGETKMNCMKHAIRQSLQHAYAHHIQRLMVTGNFALLTGIDPKEVDEWYLGIYIDAIEWVEITNTRGMSQFADGGIVGTKPYISSANYIDKMSDYCKNCHYNKKEKLGEKSCPFNSLYWRFFEVNRTLLGNNPRMGMMYRVWDKNSDEQKSQILKQAEEHLSNIENL